jgi:hypothetical protein
VARLSDIATTPRAPKILTRIRIVPGAWKALSDPRYAPRPPRAVSARLDGDGRAHLAELQLHRAFQFVGDAGERFAAFGAGDVGVGV